MNFFNTNFHFLNFLLIMLFIMFKYLQFSRMFLHHVHISAHYRFSPLNSTQNSNNITKFILKLCFFLCSSTVYYTIWKYIFIHCLGFLTYTVIIKPFVLLCINYFHFFLDVHARMFNTWHDRPLIYLVIGLLYIFITNQAKWSSNMVILLLLLFQRQKTCKTKDIFWLDVASSFII